MAGLITSLQPVIGARAFIHTKQFCREMVLHARSRYLWDKKIKISPKTRLCAKMWLKELGKGELERDFSIKEHSAVIYSDASGTGGASYFQTDDFSQLGGQEVENVAARDMALVQWTKQEAEQSSTWREVKTIEVGVNAFKHRLHNRSVLWWTDNLPGVSTIAKGSMKEKLNPLSAEICRVCVAENIELQVKWVRRDLNKVADKLSRFVDLDDWGLKPEFCAWLQNEWECWCMVDMFATRENRKVARYYSRFAEAEAEGVDTFASPWQNEVVWTVPPPHLIPQVIQHILKHKAKGILVIPNWNIV